MKTKEWFVTWLVDFVRLRVKEHTYSMYSETVKKHLTPFFGEEELGEITPLDVQKFLREKLDRGNLKTGGGLKERSVNTIYAVLRKSLDCAVGFGYLPVSPCDKVARVREGVSETQVFTRREQRKIAEEALVRGGEYVGIVISLYLGLRIGEVLALKWTDLNLGKGILSVNSTLCRMKTESGEYVNHVDRPKSRSSMREVPLPPKLVKLLRELKKSGRSEYVVSDEQGRMVSVRAYQHKFQRFLKKIGVRRLGFHSLRHTFATRAVECGVDVKTVSELLGHKNAQLTLSRYVHSMAPSKRRAVKLIENM